MVLAYNQFFMEGYYKLRPYLFDSSVYAYFWAEDKVGRKGKNNKKKQLNFFILHLIFSDNPRSVERQQKFVLNLIFSDKPRLVDGQKKGGGELYEWFVKIGEMQHDMIDFLLFLAVFFFSWHG